MVNPHNPHEYAANVGKSNFNPRDGGYYVAQAVLALTYSQDTANLIAWYNSGMGSEHVLEAAKEINKRLGMT